MKRLTQLCLLRGKISFSAQCNAEEHQIVWPSFTRMDAELVRLLVLCLDYTAWKTRYLSLWHWFGYRMTYIVFLELCNPLCLCFKVAINCLFTVSHKVAVAGWLTHNCNQIQCCHLPQYLGHSLRIFLLNFDCLSGSD